MARHMNIDTRNVESWALCQLDPLTGVYEPRSWFSTPDDARSALDQAMPAYAGTAWTVRYFPKPMDAEEIEARRAYSAGRRGRWSR